MSGAWPFRTLVALVVVRQNAIGIDPVPSRAPIFRIRRPFESLNRSLRAGNCEKAKSSGPDARRRTHPGAGY